MQKDNLMKKDVFTNIILHNSFFSSVHSKKSLLKTHLDLHCLTQPWCYPLVEESLQIS